MVNSFTIGFTYNLERKRNHDDPFDLNAEFDSPRTILGIKEALEWAGHKVICIEANQFMYEKLIHLKDEIDIIFNIAEGYLGDSRESIYPIFFESLNLPYTGSDPATLSITLNKDAAKTIWKMHNIPTPAFQVIYKLDDLDNFNLQFPVIVKPNHEGTSKGITNDCYVENFDALRDKVQYIHQFYCQEAIVEEFIEGREFTVSILGNDPYTVFSAVEIDLSYLPSHLHRFCSYEVKMDYDRADNTICSPNITPEQDAALRRIALEAYKSVNCRDFGRCDMIMDKEENIYVLEINPLPGISSDPAVNHTTPKIAIHSGYSYPEFINEVLNEALKRYGMIDRKA